MILEMGQLCESLAANFAGKRLFPGMDELVPLKFGRCRELFTTVRTLMAPVVHGGVWITIGTLSGATAAAAHLALEVQW